MKNTKTNDLLIKHYQTYPNLDIQDIFKYIYQSVCGCEHMISSPSEASKKIIDEHKLNAPSVHPLIESLDGEYSRISLDCLNKGMSAHTLGMLFFLSAKKESNIEEQIKEKLNVLRKLIEDSSLPFNLCEFEKAVTEWANTGFCAIHHSDNFRKNHKPSYRVISNSFVPFIPLFIEIDKGLKTGSLTIAVDGGSASGKTTLSKLLSEIYSCNILHIDDFFLRPEQRTPERYKEVGGNFDRERFLAEVLIPHSKGETVKYRPFDCSTLEIEAPKEISPRNLTVIEGAYSMHPELTKYYNFSIFLDVSKYLQKERILTRNSPELAKRFFNEWIPLEQVYFEKTNIKRRCDILIQITKNPTTSNIQN